MDIIISRLTYLKSKVELSNSINLTDVNIFSENFYRDFLNYVFGYDLININIIEPNAAAIDLGDENQRLAIQVTSTSALKKTEKTVLSFISKMLYEKYDRLIILNITSKSRHRDKKVGESGKYELNTEDDIWDLSNLVKYINDLTLDQIKSISLFLQNEIRLVDDQEVVAKEVRTFISLIEYLSDESQPSAGNGFIEAPDPQGKIYRRFSEHSDFLTNEYQDLYIEYGQVLDDVIKQSDIGTVKVRRLGLYLRNTSDKLLTENNGDAILALSALIREYGQILSGNGIDFDESAIRFFLVDQLIRCNVFPNKAVVNG
ncbi:SMEK domain-containing protein [Sphingobacterium siyangense]|uniref:SMEK domain-containing protein n=1 Tax=Sphingobacterium siyangense TaxID=459529 RepID=UPI002FDB263C